jgi:DNA-binding SARP family transcriptional activator
VTGAAVAAVLAFTLVPAVLVFVVGNPLAGGLGHAWRPDWRDALCVVVAAAWVAWAACCLQLLRTVAAQVRRGGAAPFAPQSPLDRLAARIAVGVLALSSLGAPLAPSTAAGALGTTRGHVGVPTTQASRHGEDVAAERVAAAIHLVRPGDSLWGIAEEKLDDGADWTAIAALNLGRDMADGTRFVDPDHVRSGWRLRLPHPPTRPGDAPAAHGQVVAPSARPADGLGSHLPELVALGLGSLTCAALARRARRHREGDRFTGELALSLPRSDGAVDTAALMNRFADVPALASFEAANMLLGRLLAERPVGAAVRAIGVGPEGVTFWLTEPRDDAPDGFSVLDDGAAWHVAHAQLDAVEPFHPFVPLALPVGDDEEGTWLVALGAGSVLPVVGEGAADLCRAARAAQESWSWADVVAVTSDPADAEHALEDRRTVLHFGDPGLLSPGLAGRLAVVTTVMTAASDLTVLVDRHGTSIHPLGRVVRPQLLGAERARLLDELVSAAAADGAAGATDAGRGNADGDRASSVVSRPRSALAPGQRALVPGPVDVRLLTATPRLDGLHEELPPNRARRAVELVAYLALHQPDVITSDRLRTRVLGSSDADAAAKTLFNVAHAARRAMGSDEQGEPLFPTGTRNGLYQVSPLVTVDVHRAAAFVAEGKVCRDPQLAMAHLRAALELVEGEPLANALSGYSWWEAEGHGGRVASFLVDAACSLATQAAETGSFSLAWLGLERARLAAPYSEALSRAAMEVAAAEGDADRLRHEWRECQRRVDVLDPGSSPSIRTESLYGELARRVLIGTAGNAPAPGYASATRD